MDDNVQQAIEASAKLIVPDGYALMPSGAGHDAQVIAPLIPAGMLFVPSIGGISHHWSENTHDADIGRGAQVFVETVARLLSN
jgi:N-carbamoyl-L-amino-acid hydrolase